MRSLCAKCNSRLTLAKSFIATWTTPMQCPECGALNYRSHPLSHFVFVLACGLGAILILAMIYTNYDLAIGSVVVAFGLSVALYATECLLLPLKYLGLEHKKKTERRQLLWVVIILGIPLVIYFTVARNLA